MNLVSGALLQSIKCGSFCVPGFLHVWSGFTTFWLNLAWSFPLHIAYTMGSKSLWIRISIFIYMHLQIHKMYCINHCWMDYFEYFSWNCRGRIFKLRHQNENDLIVQQCEVDCTCCAIYSLAYIKFDALVAIFVGRLHTRLLITILISCFSHSSKL